MFLFIRKKECSHTKVSPEKESGYCPDCGKYVENKWYLTRCACCNVKRKTTIKFGEIIPENKFCPNCGAPNFTVEEVKHINFIDINFAVLIKEVNASISPCITQSWLERDDNSPIKLLCKFNMT